MCSLWTIATTMATVFKILANGQATTLAPLFGEKLGILVSDRATALNFWAMKLRQICWAHLLRKAVSFSERDGPAGTYGRELLGEGVRTGAHPCRKQNKNVLEFLTDCCTAARNGTPAPSLFAAN